MDEFDVQNFAADSTLTDGQTQTFTSTKITDFKGALFFIQLTTALDTDTAHGSMVIGMCDDLANGQSMTRRARDAHSSATTTYVYWGSTTQIQLPHPTATSGTAPQLIGIFTPVARSVSGVANGIRVTWNNAPAANYRITIVFFGGTANLTLGTGAPGTTSTAENVGYAPDVVFFATSFTLVSTTLDYNVGFGFAVNTTGPPQTGIHGLWDNSAPLNSAAIVETDRIGGNVRSAGDENALEIISFSATGWNWRRDPSNGTPTPNAMYLSMKFTDGIRTFATVVETLPGGTGSQAFTGLGMQPGLCIGIANLLTSNDAVVSGALAGTETIFAFMSDVELSMMSHSEDGFTPNGTPTNANSRTAQKALRVFNDDGTLAIDADFTSFDATGFTLQVNTAKAGRMAVLGISTASNFIIRRDEILGLTETNYPLNRLPDRRVDEPCNITETIFPKLRPFEFPAADGTSKARISRPGLLRGRVSLSTRTSRVSRPGMTKGRISRPSPVQRVSRPGMFKGRISKPVPILGISRPGQQRGAVSKPLPKLRISRPGMFKGRISRSNP